MSSFLKSIWKGNSKHKKLSEDWVKDPVVDGVTFHVKYLGSSLVETPSGEEATSEAIKTVISMVNREDHSRASIYKGASTGKKKGFEKGGNIRKAKASGKKVQQVELTVSLEGIKMVDMATEEIHLEVSIYRISYCSTDSTHDHVFAFIATNTNETMECHVFLCPKRKMAQAVTLTIAESFNTAYEVWQMSHENEIARITSNDADTKNEIERNSSTYHNNVNEPSSKRNLKGSSRSLLIDLSQDKDVITDNVKPWVCFDDEELDNLNTGFARLTATQQQNPTNSTSQHHMGFNMLPANCSWSDSHKIDLLCS